MSVVDLENIKKTNILCSLMNRTIYFGKSSNLCVKTKSFFISSTMFTVQTHIHEINTSRPFAPRKNSKEKVRNENIFRFFSFGFTNIGR